MPLSLRAPTPLEYFASLVASDDQFPLLEAAASLAMDEYPELDVQRVPGEMDLLLARLKRRVAHAVEPAQMLQTLNRYFFRDLGFGGNLNHYHDPENSYLHAVLQTRRGIPVSLAVLGHGWPHLGIRFLVLAHTPTSGLLKLEVRYARSTDTAMARTFCLVYASMLPVARLARSVAGTKPTPEVAH